MHHIAKDQGPFVVRLLQDREGLGEMGDCLLCLLKGIERRLMAAERVEDGVGGLEIRLQIREMAFQSRDGVFHLKIGGER